MIDHNKAFELLDEYLSGTLSADDHNAVENHLDSGCSECLEYIREHGEISVSLAEQLPQKEAPDKIKEKLLNQIRIESSAKVEKDATVQTTVTPIPKKRPEMWSRALAALSIAACLFLVFWLNSTRNELSDLKAELDSRDKEMIKLVEGSSLEADVRSLLSHTCTKVMELKGIEPNANSFAQLVMHPEETYGVAYIYRMPPSPTGTEYQLWVNIDNKPVSVGIFKIGESGETAIKLKDLPEPIAIKDFQITIEPEGGMPEPTGMVYMSGENKLELMDSH